MSTTNRALVKVKKVSRWTPDGWGNRWQLEIIVWRKGEGLVSHDVSMIDVERDARDEAATRVRRFREEGFAVQQYV